MNPNYINVLQGDIAIWIYTGEETLVASDSDLYREMVTYISTCMNFPI